MALRYHFSTETTLNTLENKKNLQQFWNTVKQGKIEGKQNVKLAWCSIINPNSNNVIVFCSGRTESYLKYKELINDLYHLNFSVYMVDHRGQGLSSRMTQNPQKGFVDKFDDYVDDFNTFIHEIVQPNKDKNLFLLGHSMGGAIGTLYLEKYPNIFKAAAFSSPMYGIKLPISKKVIKKLVSLFDSSRKGHEPNYVLGGKDYQSHPFQGNDLTGSQARYDNYRSLYQAMPNIHLGCPTNHWLKESINACERSIIAAQNSHVPILIFQAELDSVVDNKEQDLALTARCQKCVIPGARHEIFIETDERRNMALATMNTFFLEQLNLKE